MAKPMQWTAILQNALAFSRGSTPWRFSAACSERLACNREPPEQEHELTRRYGDAADLGRTKDLLARLDAGTAGTRARSRMRNFGGVLATDLAGDGVCLDSRVWIVTDIADSPDTSDRVS